MVLLTLLLGCDQGSQAKKTPARPSSTSASASAKTPAIEPFVNDAGKPGPAYLFTGGGLVVIDEDGSVRRVKEVPGGLADAELTADGDVWAAGHWYIPRTGEPKKHRGVASDVAVGKDGVVYSTVGFGEPKRLDEGKSDKLAAPPGGTALQHLGTTADGTLYGITHEELFVLEGEAWKELDLSPLGKKVYVNGLVRGTGSDLYLLSSAGVARIDGGELVKVKLPAGRYGAANPKEGQASVDGTLITHHAGRVFVVPKEGDASFVDLAKLDPKAHMVKGVGIDGQGRRWVGTDHGLHILSSENERLQHWEVGALPGVLKTALIVGAGPKLPDAPPEPVVGGMKGRLVVAGKPVANAPIETCRFPSTVISRGTPCGHLAVHFETKTDADGAFSFSGLPRQAYRFAFKDGAKWSTVLGGATKCCTHIEAGQTVDIGDLTLRK